MSSPAVYIEKNHVLLGRWTGTIVNVQPCVIAALHATKEPPRTDTVLISVQQEGIYVNSLTDMKCLKNWFTSRLNHGSSRFLLAARQWTKESHHEFYAVLGSDDDLHGVHYLTWREQAIDLEKNAKSLDMFTRMKVVDDGSNETMIHETTSASQKKRRKRKPLPTDLGPIQRNSVVALYPLTVKVESSSLPDSKDSNEKLTDNSIVCVDVTGNVYPLGRVPRVQSTASRCIWSVAWIDHVLTLTLRTPQQDYEWQVFRGTERILSRKLKSPTQSSHVISVCLESHGIALSILWSDGTWNIYMLDSHLDIGSPVQQRKLIGFPRPSGSKVSV